MPSTLRPRLFIKVFSVTLLIVASFLAAFLWYVQRVPERGGDFELNFRGQSWKSAEHRKDLTLFYAGYAKCPDVCPMTLSYATQAFQKLPASELEKIQFVFLSVDHANDTADGVADYAGQFFKGFIGLTGTQVQIDQTVNLIGASYIVEKNPQSYLGYSISHTDRIFLLNRKMKVIDSIPNPRDADFILQKIKEHL